MDVIRMDEKSGKALAKYPEDCMVCAYCELDCPQKAIYVSPIKCVPLLTSW
jgi:NAD-dependent dihydropyrimidine dehydrogenase PreA subunit